MELFIYFKFKFKLKTQQSFQMAQYLEKYKDTVKSLLPMPTQKSPSFLPRRQIVLLVAYVSF